LGRRNYFKEKVVVITGAAGGIGQALSRRFGHAGARVGLTDLDSGRVGPLADELASEGIDCLGLPLDITDEGACCDAMASLVKHYGKIDVLINNAGITHRSAFSETETGVFRRVMDVNYFGSINCTKAALDQLILNRGLIIVTSSVAGFAPLLGRTGYAGSKHALHGLFDSLRTELRKFGVAVTIVCPGFTDTEIEKHALDGDGQLTTHPQSTFGNRAPPKNVAEAVYRAAVRRKRLLVLSGVGRLTWFMTRCWPALYELMMARSLRSELER
jgi:NAD(P)-dependent dehydrogenase (short-subunit alcohol dehydrogenase family)